MYPPVQPYTLIMAFATVLLNIYLLNNRTIKTALLIFVIGAFKSEYSLFIYSITKTRLLKYIENFTSKN